MPRWNSCNILQTAPGANRLWQFDAKGGGFVLNREHGGEKLPSGLAAKSWSSLWHKKLNIAWLPPEKVFLRVIELPKSSFEETLSMVELQLEKLSPMPVTQIVWTIHVLPQASAENLQTVVVVIAERSAVEEFLGKIEAQGFCPDRLEAPMLDQLEATPDVRFALRRDGDDGSPRQANGGGRVDLSGAAQRPEHRARGVVVWRRAAELELHRAAARRRPREKFAGAIRATDLGGRNGRLAGRAAEISSRRRPARRPPNGKTSCAKVWASRCKSRRRCRRRNWPRARRVARRRRIRAARLCCRRNFPRATTSSSLTACGCAA